MRKIAQEELNEIIRKHELWLKDNPEGERAVLRDADLLFANLRGAGLTGANLKNAILRNANLRYAILRYADLAE